MDKTIATIVGIVLVLGLIGYAILGQVSGAKDMGDRAAIEQHKVNQMLQDPNIVTGNTVKGYIGTGIALSPYDINDKFIQPKNVSEGALFRMSKHYNSDGELEEIVFKQIDLSRTR